MNFAPLLILVMVTGVIGGSVVYVLGPERVEIVIPENVIIRRPGHIPLWVNDELTWVPENEALILVNKSGWENIELIWPENHPKTENITLIWPENIRPFVWPKIYENVGYFIWPFWWPEAWLHENAIIIPPDNDIRPDIIYPDHPYIRVVIWPPEIENRYRVVIWPES